MLDAIGGNVGKISIATSSRGGLSAEQMAHRLTDRIVYVGDKSAPEISSQARAFKSSVLQLAHVAMVEMARSERDRIVHRLQEMGLSEAAEAIRQEN